MTAHELPPHLQEELDALTAELSRAAAGDTDRTWRSNIEQQLEDLMDRVEVHRAQERERAALAANAQAVHLSSVIARSLKKLRNEAGWSARQLADAMVRLGFVTWKRITVAESESGKRRLSIEELLGVSVLFGVPVYGIMTALEPGEVVVMNERRSLALEQARYILRGHGIEDEGFGIQGSIGRYGRTIAGVVGLDPDWRPAADRFHRKANPASKLAPPYAGKREAAEVSDES